MANQNVGTPRFYISWTDYNKAIGNFYQHSAWDVYGLTAGGAYIPHTNEYGTVWLSHSFYHTTFFPEGRPMPFPDISEENSKLFTACIGNNMADVSYVGHPTLTPQGAASGQGLHHYSVIADSGASTTSLNNDEIVNYPSDQYPLSGFNIIRKYDPPNDLIDISGCFSRFYVGDNAGYYSLTPSLFVKSVLIGQYYDMPHSPELSLTMSHEYDGIKKQETAGVLH